MKKWLITAILPVFLLTGCNTIRGLGADIMKIGTGLQNTADKADYNRQIRKQQQQNTQQTQPYYNNQPYSPTYDPYYNQQLPQPVYRNY